MPTNKDTQILATPKQSFNCPVCKDLGSICKSVDKNGSERWGDCECRIRERKKMRLKFAEVPLELQGHKISNFDLSFYQSEEGRELAAKAKRMANTYVKNFEKYAKMGKGLYLYSEKAGSGKTRLAVSIGNALWEHHNASVGFMTVISLLEKIKATWNKADSESGQMSQEKLIKSVCDADLFIFDDIGTERPTSWVEEMLFHIIDTRKTRLKPTIFTSNHAAEELCYFEKLVQRISNMAIPIKFPDESVRNSLTMNENERLQLELLNG